VSGLVAVYRRELAGLFLSPLAWILLCLTLFYNAFFFLQYLQVQAGGEVNDALSLLGGGGLPFWVIVTVLPPLITMRMVSEESKSGMLEFLLTAPVNDAAVVTGKALAASTFLAVVWLCIPLYALLVQAVGPTPDWGMVCTSWLGAVLASALFCALGLVSSAASGTPLVAAFLATVVNVLVLVGPIFLRSVHGVARGPLLWIAMRIDVLARFQQSFMTGALDTAHLVFFVAWTAAVLFLAVRLVESRRWR